ncbi:MAG: NADH dehydrogenase [Fimbriimonadales bacterium]|nr:MAG: NADH dehydrogenase [Fimbriimonadales bacterium]
MAQGSVSSKKKVVILGGGFAGLSAAKALRNSPYEVVLIDERNYHLFQPLLYQVAIGQLSPADISHPLRAILKRAKNVRIRMTRATDLDVGNKRVHTEDGEIPYDFLIVATGVRHDYFGNPDWWEGVAPGLKSLEDALDVRRRILTAFELAETSKDPEERSRLLTFLIVGGGPTGVEMAGALAELARKTLRGEFRSIRPEEARILLVEGAERLLPTYHPKLSRLAQRRLERLGVQVRLRTFAKILDSEGRVALRSGEKEETVHAGTIVWAAGVRATSFGRIVADRLAARTDESGRILVRPDLSVPSHPDVFVIGDLARTPEPTPGVAPAAMQMGAYVGRLLRARAEGKSLGSFRYCDKGILAVIGRGAAVADIWRLRFNGFLAWLVWALVHIYYLIDFENRLLVLTQWALNYFTFKRGARLITDVPARAEEQA